jgi:hypothetical protein
MALKGDLRDVPILQLLNVINLARRSGTLTVEGEVPVQMSFRNGDLIYAGAENGHCNLTHMLWQSGRLTHQQKLTIEAHVQETDEKQLSQLLLRSGHLCQDDIRLSFEQHALDLIDDLITWPVGKFHFQHNQPPPPDRITVSLDLQELIRKGEKHYREWRRLREALPDLEFCLRCPNEPQARLYDIQLNCQEWRVIAASNTLHTVRQIARANQLGALKIRRIVYGLARAGLVEIIQPPQLAPQMA